MSQTWIKSREPKHVNALSLFEAKYNRAKLSHDRAKRLNENPGIWASLVKLIDECSLFDQFETEQIPSAYVYPGNYAVKPIGEQMDGLARIFGLSLGGTTAFVEQVLPKLTLPLWAEGWFAIPTVDALATRFFKDIKDPAGRYCEAVKLVLAKIAASRKFYNYREDEITPNRFRMNTGTARAMDLIMADQKGEILIVPGQFGMRYRGLSVHRTRQVLTHSEFGLGSVAVGSMLLTHPERLVSYDDLWIDVPGDEFSPRADGGFPGAPVFIFHADEVRFDTRVAGPAFGYCGSASGAVPQRISSDAHVIAAT